MKGGLGGQFVLFVRQGLTSSEHGRSSTDLSSP